MAVADPSRAIEGFCRPESAAQTSNPRAVELARFARAISDPALGTNVALRPTSGDGRKHRATFGPSAAFAVEPGPGRQFGGSARPRALTAAPLSGVARGGRESEVSDPELYRGGSGVPALWSRRLAERGPRPVHWLERSTSIKEVFVYPLHRHFRQRLQMANGAGASEPGVA